jgi:ParB family chromosome partitioning protein
MTKAVQKITLSPSRDIPFNKLVLSQSNVRRVKAGISIEQLAESIAQRTLLQSLSVRAVVDADGNETGMFEVPAGGRRYRALELLVKQKRMSKTQTVPCVVREGGIAEDNSVAENDERVGLHPLDQFRAFRTLRDLGMTEEDIAARHFVKPAIVKQRLRLASVSPKLHEVYAEDGMTLEQLMAFSVTVDHARQEQVWDNVSRSGNDEPYQIRRMLTENTVRGSDRRAQYVGIDAYEQAGGPVLRDLFENDDGGWLQDVPLLDRLVTDKLKAEGEAIAAEGWKWISVAVDFPYGHTGGLRELEGMPVDLGIEEQTTIDALNAEHDRLEAEYQDADELPDAVDQRLGEIEAALLAFEDRSVVYDRADIVRAGVFVSVDSEGRLSVNRGYVRTEGEAPVGNPEIGQGTDTSSTGSQEVAALVPGTVISVTGGPVEPEEDDEDVTKSLQDRLIIELTAHRTLA